MLLEDEPELGRFVKDELEGDGFAVDLLATIAAATIAIAMADYAVMILDRRLPDGDGLGLVRTLRARGSSTPMILVTGLDEVSARVEGLSGGADDYLVKPFAVSELAARVQALLRRPRASCRSLVQGRQRRILRTASPQDGGIQLDVS